METVNGGNDLIHVADKRGHWWLLVNNQMKNQVARQAQNFSATNTFSEKTAPCSLYY
jgi:hypothetical protein